MPRVESCGFWEMLDDVDMTGNNEFTKHLKSSSQKSLAGEWEKIGKSKYERSTGEVVEKTARGWKLSSSKGETMGFYQTRGVAFITANWNY